MLYNFLWHSGTSDYLFNTYRCNRIKKIINVDKICGILSAFKINKLIYRICKVKYFLQFLGKVMFQLPFSRS